MLQHDRRHDPYPFTWEIPLAVGLGLLLIGVLGAHMGRGLAGLTGGYGWLWPDPTRLFTSLPGLIRGDAGAGLTRPISLPAGMLTGWIITAELLLYTVSGTVGVWALRRWGPGRMKGMATAADAEATLGVSRLRRVAPIIRPDLHPTTRRGARHG